jgi:hypothetical protein
LSVLIKTVKVHKQGVNFVCGDAQSVVCNSQFELYLYFTVFARLRLSDAQGDLDPRPLVAELKGVRQKVSQHLGKANGVADQALKEMLVVWINHRHDKLDTLS